MGHGASLQEAPTEASEAPKTSDDPPRKEAFVATETPPPAKPTKNGKSKDEGKRKQSKDNSNADKDKDKENVLRAKVMSIASVTMKGPGKLRLRRQRSNNMVTPIAAIHSDGSAPHSANSSRQSSANKQQPLFSRRKDSMVIPTNSDSSHNRQSRSSSATSNRAAADDDHDRPPSGRSTPKLQRPRSRRHSRSAVTPIGSPTTNRSPERDTNAVASNFTAQAPRKEDATTVEEFD